ncbi:MAG: phosphatidate cytidylyltransferase, partial [Chloroflexi bacterium]|nr:phosphatidate cytidylyltransferase [Chloroflexota bacterium]
MLKTRALVALVALPILVVLVVLGGWWFALFVLAALLLAGDEYVRLLRQGDHRPPGWLVLALIALAWGAVWFEHPDWREPGLMALLIAGMFAAIWGMEHGETQPIHNLALAAFGGVYIGWLGSTLVAVRMLDDGAILTALLYGCVIVSDSGAYFVGRQWGRRKLSPHVSPKKTWEG